MRMLLAACLNPRHRLAFASVAFATPVAQLMRATEETLRSAVSSAQSWKSGREVDLRASFY